MLFLIRFLFLFWVVAVFNINSYNSTSQFHGEQIVVLKNGRIEAKGTQAQLLENCPLYERMWQAHVGARHWAVGGQKGGEPICSRQ